MTGCNGLAADVEVTKASKTGEWEAAIAMASRLRGKKHRTIGVDNGYYTSKYADDLWELDITS
jgi:hypothetical protein